jgi:hypothetical protein
MTTARWIAIAVVAGACRQSSSLLDEDAREPMMINCEIASRPAPELGWWNRPNPCPAGLRFQRVRRDEWQTELYCADGLGLSWGPWAMMMNDGDVVLGHHQDDLRHGQFVSYIRGRRSWARDYCSGVPHGLELTWHLHVDQVSTRGLYFKDKQIGDWLAWHENGQLARAEPYRNGVIDGEVRSWDETGRAMPTFSLVRGTGPWFEWYRDGTLEIRGEYRGGRRAGRWTLFRSDGEVAKVWDFGAGEFLGR